jgi:sn-glycerol 3-phosphate transport system substrate-binding protein
MKKKAVAIVLMAAMVMSTITACSSSDSASSSESTEEDAAGDAGANVESLENADEITSMDASDLDGTTITFWHAMGGVNGEAINTLVEKFNEENEYGITVVAEYQGAYDDEINKLKSAQLGDMGVDLVQIYDIGTRFMIDSGWIVPMQELIDASGFDSSVIEPNIAAYYTVDGTLYSMPFNSSTPILYYNKDMFEAAGIDTVPTTFEEISEAGDKLTESGVDEVISIGIYGWFFEQFVCKQGENYVNNGNGRESYATAVEFDSNGAGLNVLTAWKDLYDKGYAPNVGRGDDNGIADFSAGKSAMTLGSTASLKQILQDVDGKFEVGTAYFPSVTSDTEGGVSIGGGSLWALNNNDDVKKAATWKFIEFLVSAESQAYWNAQTGYFPVTTEAANEQVYKDNMEEYPQFQTAIDQLHDSAPEYAGALLSVFPEARSIVETEIENMLNNGTSPEDTVAAMAEQINSSITDYNDINY